MLVLTLDDSGPDQTIHIGDEIRIVLVRTQGNRARVGIEAPQNLEVHRGSVYERIQRRKRESANHGSGPGHEAG